MWRGNTMNRADTHKGFTIVELLIVIVVIAILAAITIVAYNGVQQRAKNSQVVSGVNAYIKALHLYKVDNGSYPSINNPCLGAGYPEDQCWQGDSGVRSVNSTFDTVLGDYMKTKPTLATTRFSIGIGNNMRAGAVYSTGPSRIVYYLQGAGQNCGIGGSSGVTEGNIVTQCAIILQ